ncbi:MAG: hypothetical protein KDK97_06075 [Verrucomicrobiales bacterium]|nr:hypothetical protein [Verrucomicrobiales bacterium]MCP5558335.1 hypothetical protein [Verrucomicrobiaceae bacterium]
MNVRHLLPIAFGALALVSLSSCESSGPIDARNPTVEELDRLDVQWGLKPRKSRGTPTRVVPNINAGMAASPAPAVPAMIDPTPPTVPTPAPAAPPPPTTVAPALR